MKNFLELVIKSQANAKSIVAGIVLFHTVGKMTDITAKRERIFAAIFPSETRSRAPQKTVSASVVGVRLIVKH